MKFGNVKKVITLTLLLMLFSTSSYSIDKIEIAPVINLEDISATFEEEKDELEKFEEEIAYSIETSTDNSGKTLKKKSDKIYVNLKALDKITAKTSLIKIAVGKTKYFGELEIKPLKCALSGNEESLDTIAQSWSRTWKVAAADCPDGTTGNNEFRIQQYISTTADNLWNWINGTFMVMEI